MENKYKIDTNENTAFLHENAQALLNFGRQFPSPGGGSFYLSDDGTPWKDHIRETWITSRMAHVYSIGTIQGDAGSRELAAAAVKGLLGELKDKEHGGWYAGLTSGNAVVDGKQCYAHAFVILAATSAYLAGIDGAKELLDDALRTYDTFFWNEEEGLCTECAPREASYVAQARSRAMQRNIDEAADNATVWQGKIESRTTICPHCGKPAGNGKFCNECGAPLGTQRCPNCGANVALGLKFCGECGSPMKKNTTCPSCGFENEPGMKFCGECGAKL